MTFYKYCPTKHSILLFLFLIFISTKVFSGNNDSISLGKHLKKDGFKPEFSISAGMQHLVGYGDYGISGRAYIPLPLGFRLAADYTDFCFNRVSWSHEKHVASAIQYPIFSHGRVGAYASLGATLLIDETLYDYRDTMGTMTFFFPRGTDYYINPVFGLGLEFKINERIQLYNEWIMVNEDLLKAMVGVKINLYSLGKKH